MAVGKHELNFDLKAVGLSDLACSWLQSRNVRTVGEFIDVSQAQLTEWCTCRAMRAEIAERQEEARRGEFRVGTAQRGARSGIPGALFGAAGWMVAGIFKLAVALAMLAVIVFVLRVLVHMVLY